MSTELPDNLKSLAAELDALAGRTADSSETASLPTLDGTDFEPFAELGRGGMGVVYAARQRSLDRTVAVKVLAPHLSDAPTFRARFADEAHLVAQLHHPNILDVYAAGSCNGCCYFAMEYVDGSTARDHVFASLDAVATFGITVADALAYAHGCGVLHRDIKPANILIGADGMVKVGDFGLACLVGAATDASGTRSYMAPELLRGERATVLSDVYALGATLAEEATPHLHTHPDADFAAILDKATAADPADRYVDMMAFSADLRRFRAHEPLAARPPSALRRIVLWTRRNPSAAVGAAAALLLAFGLFAALAVGYVRTSAALAQVEVEATNTANALIAALTATDEDRAASDKRLAKLKRAKETVERLHARFPMNEEMVHAIERLVRAIEFTERRGRRPFSRTSRAFPAP
ncbi:MAG: serine/threonine-protein kinase [Pseudomonadota bacterium]|nr:serine/threonine-protein kinase [Pseudomonadota bacterium]